MKSIPIINSCLFAMVDDEDYEYLSGFKWYLSKKKYARRFQKGRGIMMHRDILKPEINQIVDHKDRDGLNNTRSNLRICSKTQNQFNKVGWGKSKYKGVDWHNGKWRAKITTNRKQILIGHFKEEIEAALAYDTMSKLLHGDFSRTNF